MRLPSFASLRTFVSPTCYRHWVAGCCLAVSLLPPALGPTPEDPKHPLCGAGNPQFVARWARPTSHELWVACPAQGVFRILGGRSQRRGEQRDRKTAASYPVSITRG